MHKCLLLVSLYFSSFSLYGAEDNPIKGGCPFIQATWNALSPQEQANLSECSNSPSTPSSASKPSSRKVQPKPRPFAQFRDVRTLLAGMPVFATARTEKATPISERALAKLTSEQISHFQTSSALNLSFNPTVSDSIFESGVPGFDLVLDPGCQRLVDHALSLKITLDRDEPFIVGHIKFFWIDNILLLGDLYIKPEFQHLGLGTAALDELTNLPSHIMEHLKDEYCDCTTIDCSCAYLEADIDVALEEKMQRPTRVVYIAELDTPISSALLSAGFEVETFPSEIDTLVSILKLDPSKLTLFGCAR